MWVDARWKEYASPGKGWVGVVYGVIAATVAWFFDLGNLGITVSAVAGYVVGTTFKWMDTATNGLWRVEEKLDDIESRLDAIELNTDSPDDRPDEYDF